MIMPALLLQKPSTNSNSRDHQEALKRRLALWQKGDMCQLLKEVELIQKRLKDGTPSQQIYAISKRFSALMKCGRTNAAIKLLSANMVACYH